MKRGAKQFRHLYLGVVIMATGISDSASAERAVAEAEAEATKPLSVFVSIPPQVELVERIGGARVRVESFVAPGQNHETAQPSPRQISRLARADVYFAIGVPFEETLLARLRNARNGLEIVDTCEGIDRRRMIEPHHHEDDGGPADGAENSSIKDGHAEHAHDAGDQSEALDPHTWLDPRLLAKQARVMRDTLIRRDPAGREGYMANEKRLADELKALDEEIREMLAPLRGRTIFVYHPAFGYFTDAYGLRQAAIEMGGKSPGPQQLVQLIEEARREDARVIFVQPQFSQTTARTLAEAIDGAVVPLDPLAREHIANLRRMASEIARALAARQRADGEETDGINPSAESPIAHEQ